MAWWNPTASIRNNLCEGQQIDSLVIFGTKGSKVKALSFLVRSVCVTNVPMFPHASSIEQELWEPTRKSGYFTFTVPGTSAWYPRYWWYAHICWWRIHFCSASILLAISRVTWCLILHVIALLCCKIIDFGCFLVFVSFFGFLVPCFALLFCSFAFLIFVASLLLG